MLMSSCDPSLFAGAKGDSGFANGAVLVGAAVLKDIASNFAGSSADTVAFVTVGGSVRGGAGAAVGPRTCWAATRRLLALICMGWTFCPLRIPNAAAVPF